LVKNPEERSTPSDLLEHGFLLNIGTSETVQAMIQEAILAKEITSRVSAHDFY